MVTSNHMYLFSGCSEGAIKQWKLRENYFECYRVFDIKTASSKLRDPIWSFDLSLDKKSILVNTKNNHIFEVLVRSAFVDERVFLVGHHGNGVNCIDVFPKSNIFVTAGRDGSVHVWDLSTHILNKMTYHTNNEFFCCSFSNNGSFLAAAGTKAIDGSKNCLGLLVVHSSKDLHIVFKGQYPMKISSVQFSPQDNIIAVTSGMHLYLHNIKRGFIPIASIKNHNAHDITESIFTNDSKYIQIIDSKGNKVCVQSKNGQTLNSEIAASKRCTYD